MKCLECEQKLGALHMPECGKRAVECPEVVADDCDSDAICPETGKQHIPDWKSVVHSEDGDTEYLDVNCKDCGRSGCFGAVLHVEASIDW